MKKLLALVAIVALIIAPITAQPKNETLDKLVNIGITNGEVNVSDVETLFPEMVSKTYVIETVGTKRSAQTKFR